MEPAGDPKPTVLVVEADADAFRCLVGALRERFTVVTAPSAEDAEMLMECTTVQVIVCSHELPDESGVSFLRRMRTRYPNTQRILVAADSRPGLMTEAINEARVFRYFQTPVGPAMAVEAVDYAVLEFNILDTMDFVAREHTRLRQQLEHWPARCTRFAQTISRLLAQATRLVLVLTALVAAAVLVVAAVVIIGLGVVYVFKTFFGIDLLQDAHLGDIITRLLPLRG